MRQNSILMQFSRKASRCMLTPASKGTRVIAATCSRGHQRFVLAWRSLVEKLLCDDDDDDNDGAGDDDDDVDEDTHIDAGHHHPQQP